MITDVGIYMQHYFFQENINNFLNQLNRVEYLSTYQDNVGYLGNRYGYNTYR